MSTRSIQIARSALWSRIGILWERLQSVSGRVPKRLRLCESLTLGERRFVAVVEFDKERFLVGATASSMVLLSRLEDSSESNRERPRGDRC